MSEDAVVRVVLVDSTSGASRTATQSSTAGLTSSSSQGYIDPNRLFRELTNITTSINQGFKNSLIPVVSVLGEIRDILDRDYDYSEKDYRESTQQTSLLKVIGASLSGDRGAITREITKGVGLHTADTQMISALNSINANIRDVKLALSPEEEKKKNRLIPSMIAGSLFSLGVTRIPDLLKFIAPPTEVGMQAASVGAQAAGPEAASLASQAVSEIGTAITQFPVESAALIAGAIAGGLLYMFSGGKPEKEKSVNELLQEIVTKIEDQSMFIQSIGIDVGIISNKLEDILSVITPFAVERGVNDLAMQPDNDLPLKMGYETDSLAQGIPISGDTGWNNDIVPSFDANPEQTAESQWQGWQAKYKPEQFLSEKQRGELATYLFPIPDNNKLTAGQFANFLDQVEQRGGPPQYFARGGTVGSHPGSPRGTDTVPAWLTPGETVIPRHMADGGIIGTYGNMLVGSLGTTDPSSKLEQFGGGIAAIGAKLSTAVPVVGAFVQGLGEGVKVVGSLVAAINESVDKYAEYSPAIAQAQAMVEIRQTMGDMRRAQEIGGDMARFVVAQGEMQQKFEETKIKLLIQVVPAINKILEVMNSLIGSGQGIEFAIGVLTAPLNMVAAILEKIHGTQEDAKMSDMEDPTHLLTKTDWFDTEIFGRGGAPRL